MVKVFETEWFSIDAIPFSSEGEDKKPYYCISCNDSVAIIAKTAERKIILIRQYRPPISDFLLEFPSGYVDGKESPEGAAKRELLEETGYICNEMVPLGEFKVYPSRIKNTFHVFFGKNARKSKAEKKTSDGPELVLLHPQEFKKLIIEKKCVEISSIGVFLLAELLKLL